MKQDGADFAIGQAAVAVFNNNKTAEIKSKTLELSTADLSESLVNLMVFQRAFEANAKSITTADELLTTLIGLKR